MGAQRCAKKGFCKILILKGKNLEKLCSFVILTKKIREKHILIYSSRSFVFISPLFF